MAFDGDIFDSSAFDTGDPLATGAASFGLRLSVGSPLVFDSSAGLVRWSARVLVGGVDVSARVCGQIRIEAGEDSARLAVVSLIPASPAELESYDSAPVSIDVTLYRPGVTATVRRFTGVVERPEFSPAERLATLYCRDGWQERPAACASAAEVEALFGGLAYPCPTLLPWNAGEPDPAGYFTSLLETMTGATAIDSAGLWRAVRWDIGTPLESLAADDVFADSLNVIRPSRAAQPAGIDAALHHRFLRLHNVEKNLLWSAVQNTMYVTKGLPVLPKSTVLAALHGAGGWYVKGEPTLESPLPGSYPVIVGAQTVYYIVSPEWAPTVCDSLDATLYRRWYQEVEVHYRYTIAVGGTSERTAAVDASLRADFDGNAWESPASAAADLAIYAANGPNITLPPTGYEGLPEPHPPANGALDWFAGLSGPDLDAAAAHVVSRALRQAAAGKRQQQVVFERPLDPRREIGDVLAIDAYGVSATGQIVAFDETLDIDSGACVSRFTLACPDGSGTTTGFTATVTPPTASITHALTMAALGNHIGADNDTPNSPFPDPDTLLGFLCNTLPTSDHYNAAKPVYEQQFRLVMPAIPAPVRDPLEVEATITAAVQIAGSGITVSF